MTTLPQQTPEDRRVNDLVAPKKRGIKSKKAAEQYEKVEDLPF